MQTVPESPAAPTISASTASATRPTPRPGAQRVSLDAAADAIVASRRSTSTKQRSSRTGTSTGRSTSIAHQLERDRLQQRATRVRQVIHALRERAEARDTAGGAPRPLRAAIDDFSRELAELERRLQHTFAPR